MAIFGNDNADLLRQILGQLGRVGEDLSALKQQLTDQQHAIDQIRQDATAAINTGLTENRAVVRDGLAGINERFSDPLTHIGAELGAIRTDISQLDTQLQTRPEPEPPAPAEIAPADLHPAPPAEQPAPAPEPSAQPQPPEPAADTLRAAAGIAHATIEAHRDTWAFLVQVAGNEKHFHIPGEVKDEGGFVSVRLSGPSLVAAITSLDHVTHTADNPVTQAIAHHIHGKITAAVKAIIERPRINGDGTPVRITIDDQAQADDIQTEQMAAAS
jgi:hypothetical protein